MILTKLSAVTTLARRSRFLQRLTVHGSNRHFMVKNDNSTISDKKKDEDPDPLDEPIKFSSSKAASWNAVINRTGVEPGDEKLWYQPIVVIISTATFMIYFFVMREENDIDDQLTWELSDHFEGEKKRQIEESQKIYWDYLKERGVSTGDRQNSS